MTTRDRIVAYVEECDHSPTVREIAKAVGRSHSTVHTHLESLAKEGRIRLLGEQRRIYPKKAAA